MPHFILSLTIALLLPLSASAQCLLGAAGATPKKNHDLLSQLLSASNTCPTDVRALREQLSRDGLKLLPTMVANRGFHNPGAGSFSLFELAQGRSAKTGLILKEGDFFFGHFTEAKGASLELAQDPAPGALMVELIAWDPAKKLYNFYELIGAGTRGQWFYRGDSADIAADVSLLHLQKDPSKPVFGQRLRCSGCHTNGGPIMKELTLPHNDWWAPERPLLLGGRTPAEPMAEILKDIAPAQVLAHAVRAGMKQLTQKPSKGSLTERLRPVFCPVELNLASSPAPNEARPSSIEIPAGFFVDERLANGSVALSASAYESSLRAERFSFPETGALDGDHAWLTPVKAASDARLTDRLVEENVITKRFLYAMLAVDAANPVFSTGRCSLLKLVPEQVAPGWEQQFLERLQNAKGTNAFAAEAALNLTDPARTPTWFKARGEALLNACRARLGQGDSSPYVALLAQRREEARASEISRNPRGQILEPGFRVIFPEPASRPVPGRLRLNSDCEVVGLKDLGTK
jgi:hypothetical protein